jgi:hypothetical protein
MKVIVASIGASNGKNIVLECNDLTNPIDAAAQHLRAFVVRLCTDYTPYSHPPRKISILYSGQVPL